MDPVTALAIQGGLAGAQAIYGGYQQKRAKQGLAMLEDPLATTPAARLQMLNASRDQTVANQALNEINRSLGTSVNALQSGGARAAGALSGVQRAADAAKLNVLARQEQRQDAAMSQFAQAGERDRFMRNQRAMQNERNLQRAQQAGVQNIANAAISLGTGLAMTDFSESGNGSDGAALSRAEKKTAREARMLKDQLKSDKSLLNKSLNAGTDRESFGSGLGLNMDPQISTPDVTGRFDGTIEKNAKGKMVPVMNESFKSGLDELLDVNISEETNLPESMYAIPEKGFYKQGLRPDPDIFEFDEEIFKRGGKKYKAKKTPGKFSHKTNPLHIVSNNGSKVGEMTGGEYIFNPKQAASLRKHSKSGSSPLHKFVRQMLSKSQFK